MFTAESSMPTAFRRFASWSYVIPRRVISARRSRLVSSVQSASVRIQPPAMVLPSYTLLVPLPTMENAIIFAALVTLTMANRRGRSFPPLSKSKDALASVRAAHERGRGSRAVLRLGGTGRLLGGAAARGQSVPAGREWGLWAIGRISRPGLDTKAAASRCRRRRITGRLENPGRSGLPSPPFYFNVRRGQSIRQCALF